MEELKEVEEKEEGKVGKWSRRKLWTSPSLPSTLCTFVIVLSQIADYGIEGRTPQ